ncbi:phytanoyl-CoA dioxygenase [Kiloniella spongiae]|uniref:Phytanoyl-CoA dioxygenase n=1 Tax=Kiloniella spongiae TaxID=1489064 RepID=A0A0H2MCC8_9PROT|nr:phytanoyl-CoA dioxygenase family protein [Kiloniella spongiae]KLN59851.1 phytanoyl-CoA dioxygenase [Kiloniella spongiae]
MNNISIKEQRDHEVWVSSEAGDLEIFREQTSQITKSEDWPYAQDVIRNIVVYDGQNVRGWTKDPKSKRELMAEWTTVLSQGPGVLVIKRAMADLVAVDRATEVFEGIISAEKETNLAGGDHFAKAGSNDRIWNALEKHCIADPVNFTDYYGNTTLAMVSEAWLGAGYQITAQVNRVNPGGSAQAAHRDYHLGFMTNEQMSNYPSHIHKLSPLLTLQGAVAHCDMPVESGPTKFLPYSQLFLEGYLAFTRQEFQDYFEENYVQLPLEKGDAVFFNPALMHAAGENKTSDIYRLANLLQVSSAFGRAMEVVDRNRMLSALLPVLQSAKQSGTLPDDMLKSAIAAAAEGYSFPANLDLDPPVGGLAPKTQAQKIKEIIFKE